MKTLKTIFATAFVAAALLARAQEPSRPTGTDSRTLAAASANGGSVNNDSQSEQKQIEKKAKHETGKKKAEPAMQPDDPRKSPWAQPRDWNYISNL